MVIEKATPNGGFTKRCLPTHNARMGKNPLASIRRANLRRYVDQQCDGNIAELQRRAGGESYGYYNGILNDLNKSFGEKAARRIEDALGLLLGQLDVPNSQLQRDPSKQASARQRVIETLNAMTPEEEAMLAEAAEKIMESRRKPRAPTRPVGSRAN